MTQVAEQLTVGGSKEHTGRGTAVCSERSGPLIGHNVSECYLRSLDRVPLGDAGA